MKTEERKVLVVTVPSAALENADWNELVQKCLDAAAIRIGYAAIENPDCSYRWVANQWVENEENETVSLYMTIIETELGGEKHE